MEMVGFLLFCGIVYGTFKAGQYLQAKKDRKRNGGRPIEDKKRL